jgi:hypothetical protein
MIELRLSGTTVVWHTRLTLTDQTAFASVCLAAPERLHVEHVPGGPIKSSGAPSGSAAKVDGS